MPFNASKYANDYVRNNYDRHNLQMPKGRKAEIQKAAKEKGISVNAWINEAIQDKLSENGEAAENN